MVVIITISYCWASTWIHVYYVAVKTHTCSLLCIYKTLMGLASGVMEDGDHKTTLGV